MKTSHNNAPHKRGGGGKIISLNASTRFSQKVALSIACISCLTLTNLHARWYLFSGDVTKANCDVYASGGNFVIDPKGGASSCQGDSARFATDGGWSKTLILDRVTLDSFRVGTEGAGIDASGLWGNVRLNNSTIGTANIEGKLKVEIKAVSNSNNTITTINNSADRLSLSADAGSSISVTTLDQSNTPNTLANLSCKMVVAV